MVIAIDGPAGSGKSTVAKLLAEKLNEGGREFTYINSGSLYRAITLGCLQNNIDINDGEKVLEYAKNVRLEYRKDRVFLDGADVTDSLHSDEIDRFTSPLSAIVPVRHVVNGIIRSLASGMNAVVEGRDITTVVFPDAECRFYLDASAEARAMRRFGQGVSRLSLEDIKKTILARDELDKNKAEGSLKIAAGVHYLDTSGLTIVQVCETLLEKARQEI